VLMRWFRGIFAPGPRSPKVEGLSKCLTQ
jgi:hypothetical protein